MINENSDSNLGKKYSIVRAQTELPIPLIYLYSTDLFIFS